MDDHPTAGLGISSEPPVPAKDDCVVTGKGLNGGAEETGAADWQPAKTKPTRRETNKAGRRGEFMGWWRGK